MIFSSIYWLVAAITATIGVFQVIFAVIDGKKPDILTLLVVTLAAIWAVGASNPANAPRFYPEQYGEGFKDGYRIAIEDSIDNIVKTDKGYLISFNGEVHEYIN